MSIIIGYNSEYYELMHAFFIHEWKCVLADDTSAMIVVKFLIENNPRGYGFNDFVSAYCKIIFNIDVVTRIDDKFKRVYIPKSDDDYIKLLVIMQ